MIYSVLKGLKNERFPLEQILNTDIIENIIKFLRDDKDQDQTPICAFLGVLAQIAPAMGVLVERFSKLGMIKIASEFLQHEDFGVNESALAFLSNIFLTNFVSREKIIQEEYENIMKFIVTKCGSQVSVSFDTQLSVFLTSLFRGPPYLNLEKLEPLLPIVQELLFRKEGSREIALNTLICLGGFCAKAAEYEIGKLFGLSCLKSVLAFLENSREDWEIAEWALRVIGTLSDKQYVELLDFGLVEKIGELLEHNEKKIKKNAAWTTSNILISGRQCTEAIFKFQEGKIILRIFQMIQTEEFTVRIIELIFFLIEKKVAKECVFCLANVCTDSNFNFDQIKELVERFPLIETLVGFLRRNKESERMVNECLEAFEVILRESKDSGRKLYEVKGFIRRELRSCGGWIVIRTLKNHPRRSVRERALRLIKDYLFNDEDDL